MNIDLVSASILLILNFIALTTIFVRMENRFTKLEVLTKIVCNRLNIPHPDNGNN